MPPWWSFLTGPTLLNECIRNTIGLDLLSVTEFEQIVKAARVYHKLAMGENEKYRIVTRPAGHDLCPNVEHYSKLDEALRRIGQHVVMRRYLPSLSLLPRSPVTISA